MQPMIFSKQEEEALHQLTKAQHTLVTTDGTNSAQPVDGMRRKRQKMQSSSTCGGTIVTCTYAPNIKGISNRGEKTQILDIIAKSYMIQN